MVPGPHLPVLIQGFYYYEDLQGGSWAASVLGSPLSQGQTLSQIHPLAPSALSVHGSPETGFSPALNSRISPSVQEPSSLQRELFTHLNEPVVSLIS